MTIDRLHMVQADVKYACVDHPQLSPDAWHHLDSSKPVDAGARAALVCRFSCPVRDRCPVPPSSETICGDGWWDRQGNLMPFMDGLIEANQAAAYLGLTIRAFLYLAQYSGVTYVTKIRHMRFFDLEQIRALAPKNGPQCGSAAKLALHEMRGDPPCTRCVGILSEGATVKC